MHLPGTSAAVRTNFRRGHNALCVALGRGIKARRGNGATGCVFRQTGCKLQILMMLLMLMLMLVRVMPARARARVCVCVCVYVSVYVSVSARACV